MEARSVVVEQPRYKCVLLPSSVLLYFIFLEVFEVLLPPTFKEITFDSTIQSDQDWTMVKRGKSRGRSRARRDGSEESDSKVAAKPGAIKFAPIVPGKENHAYSTVKDLIIRKLQKDSVDYSDVVPSLRAMTLIDLTPFEPVLRIAADADLEVRATQSGVIRGRAEGEEQSSCSKDPNVRDQHETSLRSDLRRVLHESDAAAD